MNFYVSCERVFRPDWMARPVGVLSNNDGCLIARSQELKDAGIPMAAPYFKVKNQLQALNAVVVSSNYALYGDMSRRVMQILSRFTPAFEVYSIDEGWLDFTGMAENTLEAYAQGIIATTHQSTGIPLSMGIGSTKVRAKLASRICKKRKLLCPAFNLEEASDIETLLDEIEVGDVWGIGRRWGEKLRSQGIRTALDLRDAESAEMRQRYGVVMQRLIYELRGISCFEKEDPQPKKGIIASRSFGRRVTCHEEVMEAVAHHVTRAGEKLRHQGSACRGLKVFIQTGRHDPIKSRGFYEAVMWLKVPTSDTRSLLKVARQGVAQIFKPGLRYAKAGVVLMDILPADWVSGTFFEKPDSPRSKILMATLDRLNHSYGRGKVCFAGEGLQKPWAMRQGRKTRSYTTRWADLPLVR